MNFRQKIESCVVAGVLLFGDIKGTVEGTITRRLTPIISEPTVVCDWTTVDVWGPVDENSGEEMGNVRNPTGEFSTPGSVIVEKMVCRTIYGDPTPEPDPGAPLYIRKVRR